MKRAFILALALSLAGVALVAQTAYHTTYATEAKTLNYFDLKDTTSLIVAANCQDGLVENDRYGRYVPALAESWTSDDNKTVWTFKLRKGVKWIGADGKATAWEVTADDFVEGLRYVVDPKTAIKNVGTIRTLVAGLKDYYQALSDIEAGKGNGKTRDQVLPTFDTTVGVKALDQYTVQYTLAAPTSFFLSYLVTEMFFPVEKAFLDKVGPLDFGTARDKLIFDGAYYVSDWQKDKRIVLTRNESYWDKKNVSVKTISMEKINDPTLGLQMFMRGELSGASLRADEVKQVANTKWADYVWMTEPTSVTFWFIQNFVGANPEYKAFINNQNFRKAMYYAIDRKKLLSLFDAHNPAGINRNTVIPENVLTDEKGRDYTDYPGVKEIKAAGDPYNPAKAREYLAKALAELTDGAGTIKGVQAQTVDYKPIAEFQVDGKLPMQFLYVHSTDATDTKFALLLQAILTEVLGKENIEVVLGTFVDSKFNQSIQPGRYDMVYDSFSFKFADPIAQFGRLITGGAVNNGQYSDPEFDKLIAEADSKRILSERYALFAKAEKLYIDRAYVIPFECGGGGYTMTNARPYTMPRGGFGVTRFKYKGMILEKKPVTAAAVEKYKTEFYAERDKLVNKK